MKIQDNYSLLKHNTFGIAANARNFVEYDSVEELQDFIRQRIVRGDSSPLLHIGGGSNLLFLNDFDGTVLHSRIHDLKITKEEDDDIYIRVGAGIVWDEWVEYSINKGWFGLENLSLIPGEVGASAVQNIGAYGAEAKDFIQQVETIDLQTGDVRLFTNEECQYAYRHSIFKAELQGRYAVTHVHYHLSRIFHPNINYGALSLALSKNGVEEEQIDAKLLRHTIIGLRNSKLPDPKVLGNAGSFFKNPIVGRSVFEHIALRYPDVPHYDVDSNHVKIPSGWLIEQCGWKGKALGHAGVYEKQALVLVNLGGATGRDIELLCHSIQADVRERFSIDITPEVNFI